MKQAFGLVWRPWGVFYLKNKFSGEQKSLKTSDRSEAQRILQAYNESKCQPHFNLALARVYLKHFVIARTFHFQALDLQWAVRRP
jgi:hypothetical protein